MTPFDNIQIEITVLLGSTLVPIHQLLRMGRGAVVELDRANSEDVMVLANNVPIARGQVVLRGDHIGISITEILFRSPATRAADNFRKVA